MLRQRCLEDDDRSKQVQRWNLNKSLQRLDSMDAISVLSKRLESEIVETDDAVEIALDGQNLSKDRSSTALWSLIQSAPLAERIVCLDLSFNKLEDSFLAPLVRYSSASCKWPLLVVLNLSNNRFTGASARPISTLILNAPRLSQLDLSLNPLSINKRKVSITGFDGKTTPAASVLLEALSSSEYYCLEAIDLSCIGPWRECANFPHVSELNKLIGALSGNHTSLRRLSLRSLELTDEHAAVITELVAQRVVLLEVIDLSGNAISDIGAAKFAFVLDRTTSLRTLSLDANQITNHGLASFHRAIAALKDPFSLRKLYLSNNVGISKRDLMVLEDLIHAKVLETYLHSAQYKEVFNDSSDTKIDKSLNLNARVVIEDLGLDARLVDRHISCIMEALRLAPGWKYLCDLDLSGHSIGKRGAASISLYLTLRSSLRMLRLTHSGMEDSTIAVLADGLETNRTLLELDLSWNCITNSGAVHLYLKAFSGVLEKRRRIHISQGNLITGSCKLILQSISQAHDLRKRFDKDFSSLEQLSLSGKALRMYGTRAIVDKLLGMQDLVCRSLDLSHNALGDEGAVQVARLLRASPRRLQSIDLSFNDIGDEGANTLADALEENTTLQVLVFQSGIEGGRTKPKITDSGVVRLTCALHSHPTISSVDLRGSSTSPAVNLALAALIRSNPRISELNGASAAAFLSKHCN